MLGHRQRVLDDRSIDWLGKGSTPRCAGGFVANSAAHRNLSARGLWRPGLFRASRSAEDSDRPRCTSSGDLQAAQDGAPGLGAAPMDLWVVFPAGRTPMTKARMFAGFVERVMHTSVGIQRRPGSEFSGLDV
jgi:hypothetical protein